MGLVFRKAPFVKIPEGQDGIGRRWPGSQRCDMLGTSLFGYAKNVVQEVVSVGRAGTLVDWEGDFEQRAYATAYRAEDILNWRVERVNGRNVPTMIVLAEKAKLPPADRQMAEDEFPVDDDRADSGAEAG